MLPISSSDLVDCQRAGGEGIRPNAAGPVIRIIDAMGAICRMCGRDMRATTTCDDTGPAVLNGAPYSLIRFGSEPEDWPASQATICPDCAVTRGGIHHPGCDIDQCPRCHEQLITCD